MFKLFLIFILSLSSFSKEKEIKKIHLQNIEFSPRDTFLESQSTKIFIRDISRLSERELLVGEGINYRKYSIQIESLKLEAKNKMGEYDLIASYRNETSGKLINQIRKKKVPKEFLLQYIEDISAEIFNKAKIEKDQITYVGGKKSKLSIKSIKEKERAFIEKENLKSSNVKVKDEVIDKTEAPPSIAGNKIRIKSRKVKSWQDALKKGKKYTVYLPDPPKEEKIPFYKEEPEVDRPDPPPPAPPEPTPPEAKPKPIVKKKKRRKYNVNFDLNFLYAQVNSNDLFKNVQGDIPYLGLKTNFKLFKGNAYFNDRWEFSYKHPIEAVEYQEQKKSLTGDFYGKVGLELRPFKKFLNLAAFFNYKKYSFVSVKESNTSVSSIPKGLQEGAINIKSLEFKGSVDFNFSPKFWNEIGGIYSLILSQDQTYDARRPDINFSELEGFYHFGKKDAFFRLFYQVHKFTGDNNLTLVNNKFSYTSNRFGLAYVFNTKI